MAELSDSLDMILGEEFLTWLWHQSATMPDSFCDPDGTPFRVYMEQRIVVQGGQGEARETATVSGALSPLREARFGLGTGKKVCRALIRIEKADMAFQFTLRAEDFRLGSVKTPKIERGEDDGEPDALLLEKIFLLETCLKSLDALFAKFIKLRISADWPQTVSQISQWSTGTD